MEPWQSKADIKKNRSAIAVCLQHCHTCVLFVLLFCTASVSAQSILSDAAAKMIGEANLHPASGSARVKQLNMISFAYVGYAADSILHYANKALELAKKIGDRKGEADATVNLVYYNNAIVDYNKAQELAMACLDKYKALNDNSGMAEACLHLAQLYKFTGGFKITEEYIRLGLAYSKEGYQYAAQAKDTNRLTMALNVTGIIFRDWAKKENNSFYYDSAYNCYMKALAIITPTAGTDNLGKLYNNISQVFIEHKKNPVEGLAFLKKAEAFNLARQRYTSLSHNYGNISNAYIMLGNKQKALEYAHKTMELAKRNNNPERLMNAFSQLSDAYEFSGQYDSALYNYKRTMALSDSVTNLEKTKQISEAQTKYQTAEKEIAIKLLDMSNKSKTKNIYWMSAGLLVLACFGAGMLLLYRRMQKQKILVAEQSARLELMMKELHHRVKNNLQIVSSLLSLQSYRLQDAEAVAAMNESKQRVQAMSLIHQRLYKTDMLTQVNIKEYITDLTSSLMDAYGFAADDFDLHIDIDKAMVDVEKALPIGLILNELITNAFKYAYQDIERPALSITLKENSGQTLLTVSDNGRGFSTASWNSKGGSFGKQLIGSLCRQLRATQTVSDTNGAAFSYSIPSTAA